MRAGAPSAKVASVSARVSICSRQRSAWPRIASETPTLTPGRNEETSVTREFSRRCSGPGGRVDLTGERGERGARNRGPRPRRSRRRPGLQVIGVVRALRHDDADCVSAPKRDPSSNRAQSIEIAYKGASLMGSRSVPAGTPPPLAFSLLHQGARRAFVGGPSWVLKHKVVRCVDRLGPAMPADYANGARLRALYPLLFGESDLGADL